MEKIRNILSNPRIAVLLLFVALAGLFLLSRQTGTVSNAHSDVIIHMFESETNSAIDFTFLVRKTAHVFIFFVITLLFYNAVRFFSRHKRIRYQFIVTGLLVLLVASLDELHQVYVPGREGHLQDVGIDTIGIALALTCIWWLLIRHRNGKNRIVNGSNS